MLSYAFKRFRTLFKRFQMLSLLSYAFELFHTPSYAVKRFNMLSYAYICLHTLSYAFIRFYTLSYAFIRFHMLSYAFICFYMLLHALEAKVSQQEARCSAVYRLYLRKPVKIPKSSFIFPGAYHGFLRVRSFRSTDDKRPRASGGDNR